MSTGATTDFPWSKLRDEHRDRGDLAARPALPEVTAYLMAALDYEGRRHLLLPLNPGQEGINDQSTRGISVETRELVLSGKSRTQYIDIMCRDAGGHDAFDLVGRDIARSLGPSPANLPATVAQVLERWRYFWSTGPHIGLGKEQLLGLFGEVWFLTNWLIPLAGPSALTRWVGPAGRHHDFQWVGRAVEVKTTTARNRVHQIHGIEQLAAPENGELYLFSLRLIEEQGATNTLPTLISTCTRRLGADVTLLGRFDSLLAQAGYFPAHAAQYEEVRLRVVEEALFHVDGDFPRIIQASFASGVPQGVERLEYRINLDTFDRLRVARIPEEAPFLV